MSFEVLPGLRNIVHHWVVKKNSTLLPERLTDKDIDDLARASIETLRQRALGDVSSEWGSLQVLTSGWIVQRERGQIPFALTTDDFRSFVKLALEGFLTPVGVPEESQDVSEDAPKFLDKADSINIDAFRFAREHLARCL